LKLLYSLCRLKLSLVDNQVFSINGACIFPLGFFTFNIIFNPISMLKKLKYKN
jgi:hypothetical protein